ncbi:uncharacterized protein LOC106156905 [Lingula anatina]|uniref:Uncharacterized protein LOC106156905 n=1 Tax=Lingula anatina TaxID=7574 RepID=A0A1S3HRW8_LINAN|nr:uncharacterized protein LOC106156905 [Lingula anatina]|eukprot:XP_013387799.1 uncharacterized protein LOC106156905 [Lingula anatina]
MRTSGSRCIFRNLIVTLGWITSFHIVNIVAWPCGYNNASCSTDAYASNPENCRTYFRCNIGKWIKQPCSGASTSSCGSPPQYCRAVTCASTTMLLPSATTSTKRITTSAKISTSIHAGPVATDSLPNTGGSSDAGIVAGVVVAVVLVLVVIILGMLWWKRRNMLLSMFKRKPKRRDQSNTNDQTPHGQDGLYPNGEQVLNNTKNTNLFENKAPLTLSLSNKSDSSSISMTSNSIYSVGPDEAYYNHPDETKDTESAKDTKPCKEHVNSTENNKNTDHTYSTVSKPTNQKAENNDPSFVLMRGNSLYGSADDDDNASFSNMADEPKYAACEDDYTYTELVGDENENETKMEESDYYSTPADVHDIYYSDVK